MIDNILIARINELAHLKKTVGLTQEQAEEQQRLRRVYLDSIRGQMKDNLDSISIVEPDGSVHKLEKKRFS